MADLDIDERALEPDSAAVDGQSVKNRPLRDLIAAEVHESRKEAAARTGLPFKLAKFRPPGTV